MIASVKEKFVAAGNKDGITNKDVERGKYVRGRGGGGLYEERHGKELWNYAKPSLSSVQLYLLITFLS